MPPTAPWVHKPADKPKHREDAAEPRGLKRLRVQRGYTQHELADLCGMHRNTIQNIERGLTREIQPEHAQALAKVLKVSVEDLGVVVRAATSAPSIRLRQLTPEQREIVHELLSLPAEDYGLVRKAIGQLRERRAKRRDREGDR